MLVTRSWKYCTISENMKLKALKLTCPDDGDGGDDHNKKREAEEEGDEKKVA